MLHCFLMSLFFIIILFLFMKNNYEKLYYSYVYNFQTLFKKNSLILAYQKYFEIKGNHTFLMILYLKEYIFGKIVVFY